MQQKLQNSAGISEFLVRRTTASNLTTGWAKNLAKSRPHCFAHNFKPPLIYMIFSTLQECFAPNTSVNFVLSIIRNKMF